MIVYKATCTINNKVYIGITKNSLKKRKQKHYSCARTGEKKKFYSAIRKYKEENFVWEVIDEASCLNDLNKKEIHWIEYYNSFNHKYGYNMTLGGDGSPGHKVKHSEETKVKIKRKSMPFATILNELEKIGYKIFLLEKDYKGIFQDAYFMCNNGHKYKTFLHSIIKRKSRCAVCNKRILYSKIKEKYEQENFTLLTTQEQYYKSAYGAKQLSVVCNNGHANISNFHNFAKGTRCLKCFYDRNKLSAKLL